MAETRASIPPPSPPFPPRPVDFALPPDPPPRGPMLIHPPLWCMLFFVACMLGLLSYVIWVAIHG